MSALPSSITVPPLLNSLQAAYAQLPDATPALQARRRRAWDMFIAHGIPTKRDEDWKYTNLQALTNQEFALATTEVAGAIADAGTPGTYRLLFVNGRYQATHSVLPQQTGVNVAVVDDLQHAPTAVTAALDMAVEPRFAALNTALAQHIVLIELDHDVVLEQPLQLSFVWHSDAVNLMAHPRIVVRLGRHSRATLLEKYESVRGGTHFTNALTTVQLADGARLEHGRIQQENDSSFHLGVIHADIGAQATLVSHQFNLGAALARVDIHAQLHGADASVELNGLQFATNTQHHDTHTRVEHRVPQTRSSEDYRGIADQRGRVVFNGKVKVHPHAIGTDAQQSSRNLLLAARAEIDTKPELEIYADDVKCAHGATIGQLDANALFYLRSRGLDAAQARALLTQAFADAVISRMPLEVVRNELAQAVHARFGATAEVSA